MVIIRRYKPPYTPNDAIVGTEHTWLKQEVKRMFHFLKGESTIISNEKRQYVYTNVRRFE